MTTPETHYARSGSVHIADQAIRQGPTLTGVPAEWPLFSVGQPAHERP